MKNKKGFIQIIVILVVLALIGAAYYFGTLKNKQNLISDISTSGQLLTDDGIVRLKTYTTNKLLYGHPSMTLKYPYDWKIEENDDGMENLDLKLSKNGYIVNLAVHPIDGGICLFEDSPKIDEQGLISDFRSLKYTEIKNGLGILRYFITPRNPGTYSFCGKAVTDEHFWSLDGIGRPTISLPKITDNGTFQEALEIIKSISINK